MRYDDFRWIDAQDRFRLAIHHRPRGGSWLRTDLEGLKAKGTGVLVSMQPEDEASLMGLGEEPTIAAEVGLEFLRFPIQDHAWPDDVAAAIAFADELGVRMARGEGVLIHCFAGIGRSGLMAVLAMARAGFPLEDACIRASMARGVPVPETPAQLEWLRRALA